MVRQTGNETKALALPIVDFEFSAEQGDSFGHTRQAKATASLRRSLAVVTAAIVSQRNIQMTCRAGDEQFNLAGTRMADYVGQPFLYNADSRLRHVITDRHGITGGAIVQASGPWRTSGEWWVVNQSATHASGMDADRDGHPASDAAAPTPSAEVPGAWDRDDFLDATTIAGAGSRRSGETCRRLSPRLAKV